MKKIAIVLVASALTILAFAGVASAEDVTADVTATDAVSRLTVTFHDPAVVAGRRDGGDPTTLTYYKVNVVIGAEDTVRVLGTLDTERTSDILDPEDLAEANGVDEFQGDHGHAFYLKDGQKVTLELPTGAAFEVDPEARAWFPCGYEVTRRDPRFVSYAWVYPSEETLASRVDAEVIDVDILPTVNAVEAPESTSPRAE